MNLGEKAGGTVDAGPAREGAVAAPLAPQRVSSFALRNAVVTSTGAVGAGTILRQQLSMPHALDDHRVRADLVDDHVGVDGQQLARAGNPSWPAAVGHGGQAVAGREQGDGQFVRSQRVELIQVRDVRLHVTNGGRRPGDLHGVGGAGRLPSASANSQSRTRSWGTRSPRCSAASASSTAARSCAVSMSSPSGAICRAASLMTLRWQLRADPSSALRRAT